MVRALALAAPLVIVAGLGAGVVSLACSTAAMEHVAALAAGSAALLGGALALALPLALMIVSHARPSARQLVARWAMVPPLVSGVVVGWAMSALHLAWPWPAALAAAALAMLPRLVTEIGASLDVRTSHVLVDAALALGLRRSAAVRLALSGEVTMWRAAAAAVASAASDGVAALAAVLLVGARVPATAELALWRATGNADSAELGACALVLMGFAALSLLPGLPRARRSPAHNGALHVAIDRQGARA